VTSTGDSGSADAPRTVLIVEDEPAIRVLARAALARGPGAVGRARIVEAPDLTTGRRLVADERPDVVILDVQLPDGSGLDLARELAAHPPSKPHLVVASASVLPAQRAAAFEVGADVFLAKPYRPDELVAVVARLLGGDAAA
jgi:DNA-binding response OmpR family regulator